ncbi:hypothetical protein BIV24_23250 [Streptomyces colonosanans]|uniref:Gram-positive cocci surface proteins LPxTG domain-containing protein n=1 Tax=Streptomyces colonosanans TaxID=1428652 RepID=A0A1S2P2U8_9ACTN|nr:hypothetical protein BIV24_23250 [Streptomyces colonosanans]
MAAVVLFLQASVAALPAGPQPTCGGSTGHAFPLTTYIHGGPDRYESGGAEHTWYIDLKNTTTHTCSHIHPVVVLVDTKRVLTATQPKLEFFEGDRAHPVTFQRTDRSEVVGAFDGNLPGFTVAPGRTLTVKVRLALAPDARRNDVVAKAAIVQRRGNDGYWVGESNDYRFRIEDRADATDARKEDARKEDARKEGAGKEGAGKEGAGKEKAQKEQAQKEQAQKEGVPKEKGPGTRSPAPRQSPAAIELADSGPHAAHRLDPMIGGLLMVVGGVLVAGSPFLLYRARS